MSDKHIAYTNTDLVISIPVTFDPGAIVSTLLGATVDVRAEAANGEQVIAAVTIEPSGAELTVFFEEGTLPAGTCQVQVWAEAGPGPQSMMICTFALDVRKGFRPPTP